MRESEIQKGVMLELGQEEDLTLWRTNTGVAKNVQTGQLVRFGLVGQSDLQGILWLYGLGIAIFIEVKTATGRQSEAQRAFQQMVERRGGIYLLLRSREEAKPAIAAARKLLQHRLADLS